VLKRNVRQNCSPTDSGKWQSQEKIVHDMVASQLPRAHCRLKDLVKLILDSSGSESKLTEDSAALTLD
jgi:hypothetical protein